MKTPQIAALPGSTPLGFRPSATAALADRVVEFMFVPTVALLEVARRKKTLEEKTRIDMELRRRRDDSRRAERNGRGSCRWGTEDVRNLFEELR